MSTQIHHEPDHSRYEIHLDGERAGLADYVRDGQRISFTHTEVDPKFGGRGLAGELVRFALGEARAQELDVLPLCSYVAKVIREDPDTYLALVPEGERHRFDL